MSREGFPLSQTENNEEKIEKKHLDIPMVDVTMKECEKQIEKQETRVSMRNFLDEYFGEAIKNTEIYTSSKFGASFPYAVVRLPELAKSLYEKMGSPKDMEKLRLGKSPEEDTLEEEGENTLFESKMRKEFIFGTMFSVDSAHAFHWAEHGLDQIAKKLPEALRALSRGEEPEDVEVYGMGNPAGELGTVSEDFLDKMGDKPFEYTGELYAEFLQHLREKDAKKEKKSFYRLWGVSMGASMAGTTADALIKEGGASQSFEEAKEKNIPYVSVNMQSPVGASGSRKWQIPLGFAAEIAYQLASNSYGREVGKGEGVFMETIKNELKKKDIEPHTSKEELLEKNKVIKKLLDELRDGITVPENLKTNEIIGAYDPLMFSLENKWALEKRGWEESGKHSLGESIVPSKEENHRKFVINQTHTPRVVRDNYFKRLIKVAETMEEIQKISNS